ncbi:hypothetical protein NCCP2716_05410 [Sporosarcina sp. NCCP-2716]|uniref:hypothetical protein n=1 Tax=Sporosarcina sp. NCCP-2716 TaxID=2943679 RepID=UPI00203D99BC|nr:hypothetical protein [Sporosarcina sp. NCCP-2716]GKV68043.1 hypothetical protein NCCP2716_05410 [Sporosarcina sp. NCCP-2716]
MEQIIILIVIGLISTLFGKKGKGGPEDGKPQRQAPQRQPESRPAPVEPRRSAPAEQTDPFKRLKEITGDIYREIQEEQRKPAGQPAAARPEVILQAPPAKAPVRQPVERKAEQPARRSSREPSSRSGRLSAHNPESAVREQKTDTAIDITDEQDILKGIIFSEVLGPPKSKQ